VTLPEWARWRGDEATPWTVGIEEEVMLVDPATWALAPRIDDVLIALDEATGPHVTAETHGSALELGTDPHRTVGEAVAQLADLRNRLAHSLEPLGLSAAVAGTHPTAVWNDTVISSGERYQSIYGSMRELARREPTFALHIHVAVPSAELAVRVLNRMRGHLPLLLALSANSPFWQGRDTGLASARTPLFQAFPRVGIPRCYGGYDDYVEAIDLLLRCEAFPEPTFLWWDVRLQPRFGTVEIRVMDAQVQVADTSALLALVQCLVRLEALEDFVAPALVNAPEVLDENRFLAARDGMKAELIDPVMGCRRPVADWLEETLQACAGHAATLGCAAELAGCEALAEEQGAARQRRVAGDAEGADGLDGLTRALAGAFLGEPTPVA
jgi:carboxylate-amine ligase